jgi:CBS domain containing-hemolysin-like protein
MVFNILITIFFVFLNAFFVAAEFSIVKVRSTQIDLKIKEGSKIAKITRHLVEHLNESLSACQLGITIASLALGWIGEPVVSRIILFLFALVGVEIATETAKSIALPTAFILITVLHIVFGELAPKSLAIVKPQQTALLVSLPLRTFYVIFKPFIWLLNESANLTLKILGIEILSSADLHTEDEIREILKSSHISGKLDASKEKLLQNVFDFPQLKVKQIMVPRNKIVAIEFKSSFEQIIDKFLKEGYSRMPVYDSNIDNIVGVIYAKDLLSYQNKVNTQDFRIENLLRNPLFVNENSPIDEILRKMQRHKIHIAIVLDDFGGTAGLITLEDIIEELVGEIQDEYDEEQPLIKKINDSEYEVLAEASIDDINEQLPINLPKMEDYNTIAGLFSHFLGRIPKQGERLSFDNFYIETLSSSQRKVDKIKIKITSKQNG